MRTSQHVGCRMGLSRAVYALGGIFTLSALCWLLLHAQVPNLAHFHHHPAAGSLRVATDATSNTDSTVTFHFGPKKYKRCSVVGNDSSMKGSKKGPVIDGLPASDSTAATRTSAVPSEGKRNQVINRVRTATAVVLGTQ